jgi:hypothetical protein
MSHCCATVTISSDGVLSANTDWKHTICSMYKFMLKPQPNIAGHYAMFNITMVFSISIGTKQSLLMVSYVAPVTIYYTIVYKSSTVYCITIFLVFFLHNFFYICLLAVGGQARGKPRFPT